MGVTPASTTIEWQKLASPIAVLPLGTCEQHSTHLPLATDRIIAEYYAQFLAAELNAALLPSLGYFTSYEHKGFRGSFSLKPETAMAVIRDLSEELISQNFTRLVIVNSHGGNFALKPVMRDINRSNCGIKIIELYPRDYDDSDIGNSIKSPDEIHAGEWETSAMLYIAPDLVGDYKNAPVYERAYDSVKQADLNLFGFGILAPEGTWGNPQKASAETGRIIVETIKKNMVRTVNERLRLLKIR